MTEIQPRRSRFKKILFHAYLLIVAALLIGRDHFLLGSILIMSRWLWVILGLLFFLGFRKTGFTARLKLVALFILLLSGEYAWTRLGRASLNGWECYNKLEILTYNVFFKNKRPDLSLKVILDNSPDVMTLQEITPRWEKDLELALKESYPYKRVIPLKGTHGLAVYSRYVISSDTVLNDEGGRPIAQFVEINTGAKQILLINTHLASPAAAVEHPEQFLSHFKRSYTLRAQQLEQIKRILSLRYHDIPLKIFSGDLNTLPYEPIYQHELIGNWVNLFDAKGKGSALNFPHSSRTKPMVTLDYILLQGNAVPVSAEVVKGGSSDHYAVSGMILF